MNNRPFAQNQIGVPASGLRSPMAMITPNANVSYQIDM